MKCDSGANRAADDEGMTKSECSIKQGNNVVRLSAFSVFSGFRFVRVICGRFLIEK